jgi:NAD(P)-dependent dehydrogenase (short-subunit alcohol dehydrogenase family)
MSSELPQVALITGTSSGVGLSLAVKLAEHGWKVWATMRDTTKSGALLEAAKAKSCEANITVDAMDVCTDDSVNASVQRMVDAFGKPGVLVNNAGYSAFGSVEMMSLEECKQQFETNVFGVVRTTKACMPHFREQRAGRIINVSSVGGIWGQPFNDIYCASKFAVEGMTESQAALFGEFGVSVSLCEPGAINSSFRENAQRPDMSKLPADYQNPLKLTFDAYTRMFANPETSQTPEEVADSIIANAIDAEKPPLRFQTNPSTAPVVKLTQVDPTGAAQVKVAKDTFLTPVAETSS